MGEYADMAEDEELQASLEWRPLPWYVRLFDWLRSRWR